MNEELATLARERVARRGAPSPAPRGPAVTLPVGSTALKLVGGVVVMLLLVARWHQTWCGCGSQLAMAQSKGGPFKLDLKGDAADLGDMLRGVADTVQSYTKGCKQPHTSAICATACWVGGHEMQQRLWWACFRAWVTGNGAGDRLDREL
mmetsp:Transcript_4671/g.12435  ORF Transcript_4671/g.12435 Transcript_4671/m.12435 type:complete len:150 (+) Transcript_4671:23-472(+)